MIIPKIYKPGSTEGPGLNFLENDSCNNTSVTSVLHKILILSLGICHRENNKCLMFLLNDDELLTFFEY